MASCAHGVAARSDSVRHEEPEPETFLDCSPYSLRLYTQPTQPLSAATHVADWLGNYLPTLPWHQVHHVDISWCDAWFAVVMQGSFVARDVHQHFSDRSIVLESTSVNPRPRSVALFAHSEGARERVTSEVLARDQLALVFDRTVAARPVESARTWRVHRFPSGGEEWLVGDYQARTRSQQLSANIGLLDVMRWTNAGTFQLQRGSDSGLLLFSAELHGDYPSTLADNLHSAWATIRVDALGSLLGLADSEWRVRQEPSALPDTAHSVHLELEIREANLLDGVTAMFRP